MWSKLLRFILLQCIAENGIPGDFPLSSLPDIVSPIVKTYLSDVEKSIFTLVSLDFLLLKGQICCVLCCARLGISDVSYVK